MLNSQFALQNPVLATLIVVIILVVFGWLWSRMF